jgi:hypothetical protein
MGKFGYIPLSENFAWLSSYTSIIVFSVATVFEILAYYIPFFDNFLDTIATPLAVVAAVVLSSSTIVDIPSYLKWILVVIAGGSAATIQLATTGLRGLSSATTGGLGNPVVSTTESISSFILTIVTIIFPLVGIILIVLLLIFIIKNIKKLINSMLNYKRKVHHQV